MSDELPLSGSLASEILGHYAEGVERDRLFEGRSGLERVRTQELLARHRPSPTAVILDVGGWPWRVHARWLANQGYAVHLVDPVPLHVEQASLPEGRPLAGVYVGDARRMDRPAMSVDAVLLMGPLYHLADRTDRLRALREARRVVRSGGWVFAVGISRFTSLLDGVSADELDDPVFVRIIEQDLRDGQHRNPDIHPDYFTTAFFHDPDELQAEVHEAGWSIVETVGGEGPGWWMPQEFADWWDDETRRGRLLAAVRAVEREPSLLGLGPHLMVVARNR
jgi:SAM-dependent methyltransferase